LLFYGREQAQVLEEKLKVINEVVPTKIYNTCSSSAGAGSGDFHMYRMVRLRFFKGLWCIGKP